MTPAQHARGNNRLLLILGLVAVFMAVFFLFGFRSIYSLWCSVSGTAMTPNNKRLAIAAPTPTGRPLTVRSSAKIFDDLPVEFRAAHPEQTIEVGVEAANEYVLVNPTDRFLRIRPIHQVSPINATPVFAMRICFCFQDQVIAPHETKRFPVIYRFGPTLDPRINDVAVCYSVFEVRGGAVTPAAQAAEAAAKSAILGDDR